MCTFKGYDVYYGYDEKKDIPTITIEYHSCRIYGDCGGGISFNDALKLAIRASKEFCVFGTIGWDIAFSVDGPLIVEGNYSWGCEEPQKVTGEALLTPEIAEYLKPHYFWSRWDKKRMFPGLRGNI